MPVRLLPAESVALIFAVTADAESTLAHVREKLIGSLGPLSHQSPVYPFDYTTYYESEMGRDLVKQLLGFADRIDPAELPEVKRQSMELERKMGRLVNGNLLRRANLDPGLLSVESLVLATTKYSGHRICIAPSLYAEVTLLFRKGRYTPLEWTYPDYRTQVVQNFLLKIRAELLEERRASQNP
jgi:hypothetical protein